MYTSNHNHNQQYDQQWLRMMNLGKKFDKELEKAENGLPYEFRGVFKAMNRLAGNMVCPSCQVTYRAITRHNIQTIVPTIQQKLATGELPKNDPERGHHA